MFLWITLAQVSDKQKNSPEQRRERRETISHSGECIRLFRKRGILMQCQPQSSVLSKPEMAVTVGPPSGLTPL